MQGFDDAKVESNKVAYKVTSTNIQRLSASRLIQGQTNKIKKKDKASNNLIGVNVCIHDFDDVKEESNKAASNDKAFASRIIQECFNKQSHVSRFIKDQALP